MFCSCVVYFLLQQLMRERQQMASRPFASVAVSLEARGELTEVLQPIVDVSPHCLRITHRCFSLCSFFSNHFLEMASNFIATLLTKTTVTSYTNSSLHHYYPHFVFTCSDILYKQTHICDLLLKHQGYLVFFRISCEDQH